MKLSLKAIRFVIHALEYYQKFHDDQLNLTGLSDNAAADLANDRQYLEQIKKDFEKYQDELGRRRENANADF